MSRTPRTYWVAGTAVLLALLFAAAATVAAASGGSDSAARATPGLHSPDAGFARDMSVHHQQAVEMSFVVRDRTQDEGVRSLAYDIANTQANQRGMMLGWLDLWGLPKVVAGEPPMSWMGPSEEHGGHGGHGGHDDHTVHTGGDAPAGGAGPSGHDTAAKPGALMPGMASKEEMAVLGAAGGRDAEVLYLQLMTDHHKGGVAMAEGCARLCRTPVERELAQGMVDAQRSELALMADMLAKRGAAPRG
ncbi:hypothetical protein AMK16_14460 [Streptomyces sp. CB00455]|uniref:DUF305 domain-containing protein n=1 Tax=Streptomyces sp. CB00455 TaxID=1703927 RepID=UPI00093B1651|nr:DUF305 domain-containing protein [Streptomyces sp. CB00455]OKK19329.1 hypothetical protein AMK16_14460 [Streptomyces sp. CB00455]